MKVKVISAGSIGNHLAQAARRMGWDVTVTDIDPEALRRMREEIYPKRYDAWDPEIKQFVVGEEPKGIYDIICIGTPPDVRMKVALEALREKPRILQLEKPLCSPTLEGLSHFLQYYDHCHGTMAFMGYDHSLASSFIMLCEMLRQEVFGRIVTIDAEFREHWQGIFKAHSWLAGPEDTYLGYSHRGGGAGCEHSHALHLFFATADVAWPGREVELAQSCFSFHREGKAHYDRVAAFTFKFDSGQIGRVIQDVVTLPAKKRLWVQGERGYAELLINGAPIGDLLRFGVNGKEEERMFAKKRSDDFYAEMLHFKYILEGKVRADDSPLSLDSGRRVMGVLSRAYNEA